MLFKKLIIFSFFFLFSFGFSQSDSASVSEIRNFQANLNKEYLNPKETPLRGDQLKNFVQHPFFPINLKYRVNAKFSKSENTQPFEIPTSSGKTKIFKEYGKVNFKMDGKKYTLALYQNLGLQNDQYKDYLFLPFRDLTNGKETYGGGKYLDLKIPDSKEMIIDFNQSYQPFCAYNAYDYNCPIVPEENKLPIRIEAGVMYDDIYFH